MTTDDDRIAYLAGESGASVEDDDRANLDALRDLLSDPALWAEPDPSLEDSVVAAVAAVAEGPAHSESAGSDERGRTSRTIRSTREPRRAFLPRRVAYAAAAAAAAAALITGSVVAITAGGNGPAAVALSSTGSLPTASGNARFSRTASGWRVQLKVAGLPRLDQGRFYEAWLRNGAGVRVPIGTFNQGPGVILWSGVSPSDYPTITVTPESVSGDQIITGKPVLVGTMASSTR